jgi:hypothetical protein
MNTPRIAPGGLKELGLVSHAFCTLAGRVGGGERPRVFLRIATLRDCEYERRHHVRLGRRAG